MKKYYLSLAIVALLSNYAISQEKTAFTVKANDLKGEINPNMWGVFFEDINMGADGGIYAELIKNRSFEFYKPLMGWTVLGKKIEGSVIVQNRQEAKTANPRYLTVSKNTSEKLGLSNEGFRGMGIKNGNNYDFSFMYKQEKAGLTLKLELINASGEKIGEGELQPNQTGSDWHKQSIKFKANSTEHKAKLNIWFEGTGKIDMDMISLFPEDTWKNRPGGMRADMVQLLADMKPGFVRFPGGCIVEGHDLSVRYQWKKTVGPIEDRQLIVNRWNTEFAHRPTPDYYQTFGLGFFEYFQLSEDIGAEPLPILNCGMACQFNTAEVVPMDQLDEYVQDALDLIEFANGPTTSKWGKLRSDMGHPAPFNLKMLGIGNENWGPQYIERLKVFNDAVKSKYPNIKIVTSAGTDPDGERFDLLDKELRKMNADIIDEHYYRRPEWFLENASRYDNYDRNSSKIFAGEYAAQSDKVVSINNKNNWETAISEAAFLTGLERNADVVVMASYAPLFAHLDAWQWTPDMIWVDNLNSYGTPNYYVQKLYATNKGTHIIPILLDNKAVSGQNNFYASAVIDKNTKEVIIKIVNNSDKDQAVDFSIQGVNKLQTKGTISILTTKNLSDVNSIIEPKNVSPQEKSITSKNKKVQTSLTPYSFNVIKFKMI